MVQDVAQAFSWEDGRLMSFAFIEEFVFVCLFVCFCFLFPIATHDLEYQSDNQPC